MCRTYRKKQPSFDTGLLSSLTAHEESTASPVTSSSRSVILQEIAINSNYSPSDMRNQGTSVLERDETFSIKLKTFSNPFYDWASGEKGKREDDHNKRDSVLSTEDVLRKNSFKVVTPDVFRGISSRSNSALSNSSNKSNSSSGLRHNLKVSFALNEDERNTETPASNSPISWTVATSKDSLSSQNSGHLDTMLETRLENIQNLKFLRVVTVIHNYRPNMADELRLPVGATIAVIEDFPDGWADGVDTLTVNRGIFPLSCVIDTVTKRESSLFSQDGKSASRNLAAQSTFNQAKQKTAVVSNQLKMYTVLYEYTPERFDELKLSIGVDIILLKSFEDGWGKGYDPVSGAIGIFPLSFVQRKEFRSPSPLIPQAGFANLPKVTHLQNSTNRLFSRTVVKRSSSLVEIVTGNAPSQHQNIFFLTEEGFLRAHVTHQYSAICKDELELAVGSDVIILKQFNDGWARGRDINTGKIGMFPMVCVNGKISERI
ncbi:hypothetical protein HK100_009712 [Physocladia obscura]|uniref:SH3 domain-containing protein n=1 Tax=Physocladia obscura TaxID=109957 RepID=A0AAD5T350_9FUNG|nr:hypothetical protein HK100_009712 [Physocladia obscura]